MKKLIIVLVVMAITLVNVEANSKNSGLNLSFTDRNEIGLGYFAWNTLQLEVLIDGYHLNVDSYTIVQFTTRALYFKDLKNNSSIYYGIAATTSYDSLGGSSSSYTPTIGLEYSLNQSLSINGDFGLDLTASSQAISTRLILKYFF